VSWSLSALAINACAFDERSALNIVFNKDDLFGIAEADWANLEGIPDWKRDLLLTEDGYKLSLDILLDAHGLFLKLNDRVPHRLDCMVPSLEALPVFSRHDTCDVSRWSVARPKKITAENSLIATQVCSVGNSLRAMSWIPSLDMLRVAAPST
jgi:hypothetical protein